MEAYVDAKRNIYRHQRPQDVVVLNHDDPTTVAMASGKVASRVVWFSRCREVKTVRSRETGG